MGITVAKFGDGAMETAEGFTKAADVIAGMEGQVAVVASAPRDLTDALIALGDQAKQGGDDYEGSLRALKEQYERVCEELGGIAEVIGETWNSIDQLLRGVSLTQDLTDSVSDRLLSLGELMGSKVLAANLNAKGINAEAVNGADVISTDDNFGEATVDVANTTIRSAGLLKPRLEGGIIPVVSGSVGVTSGDRPTILGRNTGAYSAALIANALEADEVQVWTDVDGVHNADPEIVQEAAPISGLSFEEATQMAVFGHKVLHPRSLGPVSGPRKIPVRIMNVFNPDAEGTVISDATDNTIKAVTHKKGITTLNISSDAMLGAVGSLSRIFEIFQRHGVSVDTISTDETCVSVTIDNGLPDDLESDLANGGFDVEVNQNMALVCLVGEGIANTPDALARMASVSSECGATMVSQAGKGRNITFVVPEGQVENVVNNVFGEFFNQAA